jgi:hypothetical protein
MQTTGETEMTRTKAETVALQAAVLVDWIAREQEYMAENELAETEVLTLLKTALKAAVKGKAMSGLEIIDFGMKYYNATVEDLYGDTDGSDELEEDLAATL